MARSCDAVQLHDRIVSATLVAGERVPGMVVRRGPLCALVLRRPPSCRGRDRIGPVRLAVAAIRVDRVRGPVESDYGHGTGGWARAWKPQARNRRDRREGVRRVASKLAGHSTTTGHASGENFPGVDAVFRLENRDQLRKEGHVVCRAPGSIATAEERHSGDVPVKARPRANETLGIGHDERPVIGRCIHPAEDLLGRSRRAAPVEVQDKSFSTR